MPSQAKRSAPLAVLTIILFISLYLLATDQKFSSNTITPQSSISDKNVVAPVLPDLKDSECHANGPLPDSSCTPGAIFPDATANTICVMGYTKKVRNVSTALKKKVYEEYGFSYPQPRGAFEVDHLVSLELGGSNDIANLWPEAAEPVPGFHEKDLVENYLHDEVCSGRMKPLTAQMQIANDWVKVYRTLSPTQIEALMNAFRH